MLCVQFLISLTPALYAGCAFCFPLFKVHERALHNIAYLPIIQRTEASFPTSKQIIQFATDNLARCRSFSYSHFWALHLFLDNCNYLQQKNERGCFRNPLFARHSRMMSSLKHISTVTDIGEIDLKHIKDLFNSSTPNE